VSEAEIQRRIADALARVASKMVRQAEVMSQRGQEGYDPAVRAAMSVMISSLRSTAKELQEDPS
jgi:hypothetical protein